MVCSFSSSQSSTQISRLGFEEGSPDGYDPLQIAREMASRGIVLVGLVAVKTIVFLSETLSVFRRLRTCPQRLFGKFRINAKRTCANWELVCE